MYHFVIEYLHFFINDNPSFNDFPLFSYLNTGGSRFLDIFGRQQKCLKIEMLSKNRIFVIVPYNVHYMSSDPLYHIHWKGNKLYVVFIEYNNFAFLVITSKTKEPNIFSIVDSKVINFYSKTFSYFMLHINLKQQNL